MATPTNLQSASLIDLCYPYEKTLSVDELRKLAIENPLVDSIVFTNNPSITSAHIKILKLFKHLTSLTLIGCHLKNADVMELKECRKLRILQIDGNPELTGSTFGFLPESLEHLSAQQCNISNHSIQHLERLQKLKALYLTKNPHLNGHHFDKLPTSLEHFQTFLNKIPEANRSKIRPMTQIGLDSEISKPAPPEEAKDELSSLYLH